jgi:hypothetical protein
MIYTIFLCTYVTTMPQLNSCKIPPGPFVTVYHSDAECKQVAARNNTVWHDAPGANVHTRYVCMEKSTGQPAR